MNNRTFPRLAHQRRACAGCGRRARLDGIGICSACRATDRRHNTITTPYFDALRSLYGASTSEAGGSGRPSNDD